MDYFEIAYVGRDGKIHASPFVFPIDEAVRRSHRMEVQSRRGKQRFLHVPRKVVNPHHRRIYDPKVHGHFRLDELTAYIDRIERTESDEE